MTYIAAIDAKPWHCGQMARLLRRPHREAMRSLGLDCHAQMRAYFDASQHRVAWTADGSLVAVAGVTGSLLSTEGMVWMAFAENAAVHPRRVVMEARAYLARLMHTYRTLATTVLDDDRASMRFAMFLGFKPVDHWHTVHQWYMTYGEAPWPSRLH